MESKVVVKLKNQHINLPMLDKYRKITTEQLNNTHLNPELVPLIEKIIYNQIEKRNEMLNESSVKLSNDKLIRLYVEYSRHILANLSLDPIFTDNPNNYLCSEINSGAIEIENLFEMSPQQLFPEFWTTYTNEFQQYAENLVKGMEPNSTDHTCKKCKNNKTYTYMAQIRSCDEGMSLMIICCTLGCNTKWCIK